MKASELIVKLQTAIAAHGDLPVTVPNENHEGDDQDVANIVLALDTNEKVQAFLIADQDTADAFAETEDFDNDEADEVEKG